jgi:hypothetical protein
MVLTDFGTFLGHFWPNSMGLAHAFGRFWVIFAPFKLFSIIFACAKNMHFGTFLA